MRGSLEYRYQTLLHLLVVGLAAATYLFDGDDIVWALVRGHANSALLERLCFGGGALLILTAAALETWACIRGPALRLRPLARIPLAFAIAMLLPFPGVLVLAVGETILITRLLRRDPGSGPGQPFPWGEALRVAAAKWGLAASMIAFTWTLQDRIAEIGAMLSIAVWFGLNAPSRIRACGHLR